MKRMALVVVVGFTLSLAVMAALTACGGGDGQPISIKQENVGNIINNITYNSDRSVRTTIYTDGSQKVEYLNSFNHWSSAR